MVVEQPVVVVSKLPELELELEEELGEEPGQGLEHKLELGEVLGEKKVQLVECIVEVRHMMELVVGGIERGNFEQELVEVGLVLEQGRLCEMVIEVELRQMALKLAVEQSELEVGQVELVLEQMALRLELELAPVAEIDAVE